MADGGGITDTSFFSSESVRAESPPYVLVAQLDTQAFQQAVCKLINEQGYRPQGGPVVVMAAKGPVFCQALVLE